MTSKELLYIEDALGHEKFLKSKCTETADKIKDAELKTFVENMADKHGTMFNNFYSIL